MGYIYPVPKGTPRTQNFGAFPGGVNPAGGHTGIDFACPIGTPVYAPADGVIDLEGWVNDPTGASNRWWLTDGAGIALVLNAGANAPDFIVGHLNATLVNVGQRVNKGDLVAYSGNTGKWTTGPHVHFEVCPPGYNLRTNTYGRVNPDLYCDSYKEDLVTLSPQSTGGSQTRKVTTEGARVRTAPWTNASLAPGYEDGLAAGAVIAVVGYAKGEAVTPGNDAWYKTISGFFVWANAAEDNIDGLTYLGEVPRPADPAPAPAPAPAPEPAPTPAYTFAPACSLVTEIHPAAEGKFQRGNIPTPPSGVVVHQFIAGATRFDVHLNSVIETFTRGDRVASAHFGVEGKRVVQFVDLKDRAYHSGPGGNDHWGIEVYGGMDAETLATVALLIFELQKIAGRPLELFRHRQIMATQCGDDVPLEKIQAAVVDLANPTTPSTPDVVEPVAPSPVPGATPEEKEAIVREFLEKLVDEVLDDTK